MKRIKLELTEDQLRQIVRSLEKDLYMLDKSIEWLTDEHIDADAFTIRLTNKLKAELK